VRTSLVLHVYKLGQVRYLELEVVIWWLEVISSFKLAIYLVNLEKLPCSSKCLCRIHDPNMECICRLRWEAREIPRTYSPFTLLILSRSNISVAGSYSSPLLLLPSLGHRHVSTILRELSHSFKDSNDFWSSRLASCCWACGVQGLSAMLLAKLLYLFTQFELWNSLLVEVSIWRCLFLFEQLRVPFLRALPGVEKELNRCAHKSFHFYSVTPFKGFA
jgi:hypothetical protein